jgi:hypothetical protein
MAVSHIHTKQTHALHQQPAPTGWCATDVGAHIHYRINHHTNECNGGNHMRQPHARFWMLHEGNIAHAHQHTPHSPLSVHQQHQLAAQAITQSR